MAMTNQSDRIIFDDVSKFYGEVLGVNRISLNIPPGVTTLVGPNGSGKTTLMNLMTGLVQPSSGTVSVLGLKTVDADRFFREVGYCTQFDSFPRGLTGWEFLMDSLMLHGMHPADAFKLSQEALERVRLGDAGRNIERDAIDAKDFAIELGDVVEDDSIVHGTIPAPLRAPGCAH